MNNEIITKQYLITPAAGKRLIAKYFLANPVINEALINNTIVIVAGTTNAYIAEEILNKIQQDGFSKDRFFRGITLPPNYSIINTGDNQFLGDIVIRNGEWIKEKTIFDVADELKQGDIILKGANAINIEKKQAGIYIGHPKGGTIIAALQAVIGRKAKLYLPVGLEKRIPGDINQIAEKLNSVDTSGPRMLAVNGEIITELEAIKALTGAEAELVASGGVCGAEGSYWIAVSGTQEQIDKADELIKSVKEEPNFKL